ncbi:glutaredoxin 2 [Halobacteriovorax sp. GB3]|uniref:glutaredoxin 2 n=1 Tax=Halobacteriovorax sp. GB3 TaxID=2719615 RepID=UPI00235E5439|nr:glutaredoxin 2 [Halobacteriovorax sp. GB3]MDD0852074.1 glutaredoxin 2 [Halobacteriovorax sp. GB3]
MNTLYHYVHCPFCVRVRMALGFLSTEYKSVVVPYDDEKTPVDLTGVKMLPIMGLEDGTNMNESLDIIKKFDTKNELDFSLYDKHKDEIEALLNEIAGPVHNLCMPYWVWTPEFNEKSRQYFVEKKSKKRGPFNKLVQNRQAFLKQLVPVLMKVKNNLHPYFGGDKFTVVDIMIASHLWGLYVFPEFQFPQDLNMYLQKVKQLCNFDYHEDFWRD